MKHDGKYCHSLKGDVSQISNNYDGNLLKQQEIHRHNTQLKVEVCEQEKTRMDPLNVGREVMSVVQQK